MSCGNGWSSGCHAGGGPGRTSREPLVRTVHSYAFGVLRLHAARNGDPPPRLLASAEQDAVVRDLLLGELLGEAPDSGWPARLRPAIGLPGFAAELRELLLRAAERGLGPGRADRAGPAPRRAGVGAPPAGSSAPTST